MKEPNQKVILFVRAKDSSALLEDSEDQEELSYFSIYTPVAHRMMKRLGYNFKSKHELNFGKGMRMISLAKVSKRKPIDYYQKTKRGLEYVTPVPPESKSEMVESFT